MLGKIHRSLIVVSVLIGLAVDSAQAHRAVATTPLTIYASVGGVGVFSSTGASGIWQGPHSLPSDVLSLATVDPSNWRVVFAGLHNGLYVSRDGGGTWSATSLRNHTIFAILTDQRNPSDILAGTEHGVYRSEDGGATWSPMAGIARSVTTLAQVPGLTAIYAGGAGQVWISSGTSARWTPFARGLPARLSVNDIAISGTQPMTIYAATSQGVWQASGTGSWSPERGLPSRPFSVVATDPAHVYAASLSDQAVYISSDAGSIWTRRVVDGVTGGIAALVDDQQQPPTIVVGDTNGRVGYSADGGATWSVPVGGVTGAAGSPILALALIHRQPLPSDGVPNPNRADTRWFPGDGGYGHTLRGAFLAYWLSLPDASTVIGAPITEVFNDRAHGNVPAQYFERMELLSQGGTIVPAPLSLDVAPAGVVSSTVTPTIDSRFQSFWSSHGGRDLFGPPVSAVITQTNGDGTGREYPMQYFLNARLEYHAEIGDPNSRVQVGYLGDQALAAMGWTQG